MFAVCWVWLDHNTCQAWTDTAVTPIIPDWSLSVRVLGCEAIGKPVIVFVNPKRELRITAMRVCLSVPVSLIIRTCQTYTTLSI